MNLDRLRARSAVFGVRLTDDERNLIYAAATAEAAIGDRAGASAWARKILLKEARRVVHGRVRPAGKPS